MISTCIIFDEVFERESRISLDSISAESVFTEVDAIRKSIEDLRCKVKVVSNKGDIADFIKRIEAAKADVYVNLCENLNGSNLQQSVVPSLLECMGLAYTGSDAFTLTVSTNKGVTKRLFRSIGINTPKAVFVNPGARVEIPEDMRFPLIVKPAWEDASVGIDRKSVTHDLRELKERVLYLHATYAQPALVEEYIDGRELNVAVFGNSDPEVLPISEIIFVDYPPGQPRIVDFKAKWVEDSFEFKNTRGVCPASIEQELESRVRQMGIDCYRLLSCRDYARVDIRIDREGIPYVLEVNANPDISRGAGFMRSWFYTGRTYTQFVEALLGFALERKKPHGKSGNKKGKAGGQKADK